VAVKQVAHINIKTQMLFMKIVSNKINQSRIMLHIIETNQFISSNIDEVWDFISSPGNLALITPEFMNFRIIGSNNKSEMYTGQIIEYFVSPIAGIKMHWVTEITHISEKKYFIDQQRIGPYSFWHHKHFLKEVEGGVLMTDIVHYKVPYGFLGRVINNLVVRKQLKTIFDFRAKKIEEIFGVS
jgi:ligand-binding SRPBCC domain-containing protein